MSLCAALGRVTVPARSRVFRDKSESELKVVEKRKRCISGTSSSQRWV